MEKDLTLQTAAAFERIYEALMGETEDKLSLLILHLKELERKSKEIQEVVAHQINGDFE
jgi:hypothetical protein